MKALLTRGNIARAGLVARDWWCATRLMLRAVADRTPPEALATGELTPIILLPGIWEPWRFLLPLARRLNQLGHPVHPLPALGWNGRSLEDSVGLVRCQLAAATGEGAVLVAHSKGGLIGKTLLAQAVVGAGESESGAGLLGMVALCSPFGGSSLSWRAFARTPLGMFAPAGPVILALAAQQAANERIVSIGAAWDEMIPEGTHLEGAHNITLRHSGHFLAVDRADVAELVHAEVQRIAQEDLLNLHGSLGSEGVVR